MEGKQNYLGGDGRSAAAAAAIRLHDGEAVRLPRLLNVFGEFKANLLMMNSQVSKVGVKVGFSVVPVEL